MDEESKEFIFGIYMPTLYQHIGHIELSLVEKAELFENTIGSAIKLLYAFFWQEHVVPIQLALLPEVNKAGAAFTPKLNAFANNLTTWDLTVDDVQVQLLRLEILWVNCKLFNCSLEVATLAVLGAMM